MFYCFTYKDSVVCVECSQVSVTRADCIVVVSSLNDGGYWRDVKDIQVIAHPQDCLAWMGLSVDTCGNPPRVVDQRCDGWEET